MRILPILALTLLASLSVQDVAAVDLATPPPVQVDLVKHTVTDRDGDGQLEDTYTFATPQCGCNCPIVGGGADVEAADQDHYLVAATSVCQWYAQVSIERGSGDILGAYGVDPFIILYLAGLEPIVQQLLQSITTAS